MTLKECYGALGGNYDDVLGRLRKEDLVKKFVFKFLDDKSYDNLHKALEENNGEEAFRAAHTIKGVCQNLSFDLLYRSSNALTEALRSGNITPESFELFEGVKRDYIKTVEAINECKNSFAEVV